MLATCPNPTLLKQLLDGTLPEDEQPELTRHLETCDSCQTTLESLVAGKESWDGVAGIGHSATVNDSNMREMLAEIASGRDPDVTADSDLSIREIALDFLAPSEKSGQLGKLGRYEVLEVIGSGGFGVVLKAIDPVLSRVVAIKVLAPQLATSATARQRFAREAQAAAAVSHDHVVAIHAVEETNGLPYLVMQYIAGESLQQRLDRDGPLDVKEILRIGTQTAAGLAAAHAQGVVHRDIKPANILLENGIQRVKITDFGLARTMDDASLTQTGVITGTPQYMSPEQAKGEPVDHRADLFSLGSVLYALCTGRPPFRASTTLGVLKRVAEEPPRAIREMNPGIPDWLTEIIDKLHAKSPENRFQTAAEITVLLEQHLAHLQQPGVVAQPARIRPAKVDRTVAWQGWIKAAAAIALVVTGIGVSDVLGLTNVAATITRAVSPPGTLALDIDDPAVKVTLDGRDLVIAGIGMQQFDLPPGQYTLTATKDGMPVHHELVTIIRDMSCNVRIRAEQPDASRDAQPAVTTKPAGDKSDAQRTGQSSKISLPVPAAPNPDLVKLQGAWAVVSMHRDGQKVNDVSQEPQVVVFRGNEIIMAFAPEGNRSPQRGTFELNSGSDPKTITVKTTDGPQAGQSSAGIFAFAGDQLMLSLARPGASSKPTEFKTKPGDPWNFALLARPTFSTQLGVWPASVFPRRAPYTAIRWRGPRPDVQVDNVWYELRELNGIEVGEIIGYWAKGGDVRIQEILSDHLVEALSRQGREPGPTVKLKVRRLDNSQTLELENVPMTEEKHRQLAKSR